MYSYRKNMKEEELIWYRTPIFFYMLNDEDFEVEIYLSKNKINTKNDSIYSSALLVHNYLRICFSHEANKNKVSEIIDFIKKNDQVGFFKSDFTRNIFLIQKKYLTQIIRVLNFDKTVYWNHFYNSAGDSLTIEIVLKNFNKISIIDLLSNHKFLFTEEILVKSHMQIPFWEFKKEQVYFTPEIFHLFKTTYPFYKESSISFANWLSDKSNVSWSINLINENLTEWNWKKLSKNESIKWNDEMVDEFEQYIDFEELSFNCSLCISKNLLTKYTERWNWGGISGNSGIVSNWDVFEYLVNDCEKTIWTLDFEKINRRVFDPHNGFDEIKYGVHMESLRESKKGSSISTNSGIKWPKLLIENHHQKLDVWLYAGYGNWEGIEENEYRLVKEQLGENRFMGYDYEKYSDWVDHRPIFRLGWENLFNNPLFKLTNKNIQFFAKRHETYFKFEGNAMNGYEKNTYNKPIINIVEISIDSLEISFESLSFLPENLLNIEYVHPFIFKQYMKPILLKNKLLREKVLKAFFKIKD